MKRMLLVSMFSNVANMVRKIEPDLKNKRVTYIPTASTAEKLGFFMKIEKWSLRRLGLLVDELEVCASSYKTIVNKLRKNDIIYVSGGNTFFLLQELRRSGADKVMVEEINKGKLYIGESAGAVVASPDIEYCAEMDSVKKAPGLKGYTGLSLVDFYVVPHFKSWTMGKAAQRIIDKYSRNLKLMVIGDNEAILIKGNEVEVLGR